MADPIDWTHCVARKFKIALISGDEFTSDVFAFDASIDVIVFRISPHHTYQKADYRLVPVTSIASAADLGPADACPPPEPLVKGESDRRLAEGERAELIRQAQRGVGVTPVAQAVFDLINKTMRSAWHGPVIVVTEKITVSAPYTAKDIGVVPGADPTHYTGQVDRIRMILARAHAALAAQAAATTAQAATAAAVTTGGGGAGAGQVSPS